MGDHKLKESKGIKKRFGRGSPQKATKEEMVAAVAATGSFTDAAKLLGVSDSTIHNRLKGMRGTPEWDKMVAETLPDITELRKKLADGLNELYERAIEEAKALRGVQFMTAYGILCDKYARLTPEQGTTVLVQNWTLKEKEQNELDHAVEKAKNRFGVGPPSTNGG